MAILKFEPRTPKSLSEMYTYLIDPNKTSKEYWIGIGVNPQYAVEEMTFVQKCFYKENLTHTYVQVILSFGRISIGLDVVKNICEKVGLILGFDERQVFGAIHFNNLQNVHCHYLLNYVNVKGELYRQNYSVVWYKKIINDILTEYPISLIYYNELKTVS